jgi:hypothetical protein
MYTAIVVMFDVLKHGPGKEQIQRLQFHDAPNVTFGTSLSLQNAAAIDMRNRLGSRAYVCTQALRMQFAVNT